MDAMGIHNYGGNTSPERDPGDCGICFRRAEMYRQVMVKNGDAGTPIWATEFGWLLDPGRGLGQYDWMKVSAEQQGSYVVRSYQYAIQRWPWMAGMLLSNLDASTSPYHQGPEDGLPWFAIINADYSPRPAWQAFREMRAQSRPQASTAVVASVDPADPSDGQTQVSGSSEASGEVVRVANTGGTGVSLRDKPSLAGKRLTVLAEGTRLVIVSADVKADGRTWRNVKTPTGTAGWVASEYVRSE